jgi:FAD/FMN-containing dehydrogenase
MRLLHDVTARHGHSTEQHGPLTAGLNKSFFCCSSAGNNISELTFYKNTEDSSLAGMTLLTSEGTLINLGRTKGTPGVVGLFPSIDTTGIVTSMTVWVHKPSKGAVNAGRQLFQSVVAKSGRGIVGIRVIVQRPGGPDAPEDDYSWGAVVPSPAESSDPSLSAPILPPGVEAKDLEEVVLDVGSGKLAAVTMVASRHGKRSQWSPSVRNLLYLVVPSVCLSVRLN